MDINKRIKFFKDDQSAFSVVFRSSNEGILVADQGGLIVIANPVSERMFGYEPDELVGQKIEALVPQKYKSIHSHYRKSYHQNPEARSMGAGRDLSGQRKDGTVFPLEASLSNIEVGGEYFAVAFIVDISKRKEIEEALVKSEEQLVTYAAELEQRVQRRTEDLDKSILLLEREILERKRAESEAKQALEKEQHLNELKTRFVSMASHEFRTPLSTILSSASLIEKYRDRNELDKIDKHIDRVKGSVKNLVSILDDFLSLGRLEEGRVEYELSEFEVVSLFKEFLEDIEIIKKPGQKFEAHHPASMLIRTDPKFLRNIWMNLTSNAIKYSPEGGLIQITLIHEDGHFITKISDQGIGIPIKDQKHMFERFFRAQNVTNIQGTGLGLNIVKRYVDLLKGQITFESIPDKGTEFMVKLPIA